MTLIPAVAAEPAPLVWASPGAEADGDGLLPRFAMAKTVDTADASADRPQGGRAGIAPGAGLAKEGR